MAINHKGKKNPNYKGGRSKNTDGYWTVPTGDEEGHRKLEHRVKAGAKPGEKVHHKDHDRGNNSRGNLKRTKKHSGVGGK